MGVGEGDHRRNFLQVVIGPVVMHFFAVAEGHLLSDFAKEAVVERWNE